MHRILLDIPWSLLMFLFHSSLISSCVSGALRGVVVSAGVPRTAALVLDAVVPGLSPISGPLLHAFSPFKCTVHFQIKGHFDQKNPCVSKLTFQIRTME